MNMSSITGGLSKLRPLSLTVSPRTPNRSVNSIFSTSISTDNEASMINNTSGNSLISRTPSHISEDCKGDISPLRTPVVTTTGNNSSSDIKTPNNINIESGCKIFLGNEMNTTNSEITNEGAKNCKEETKRYDMLNNKQNNLYDTETYVKDGDCTTSGRSPKFNISNTNDVNQTTDNNAPRSNVNPPCKEFDDKLNVSISSSSKQTPPQTLCSPITSVVENSETPQPSPGSDYSLPSPEYIPIFREDRKQRVESYSLQISSSTPIVESVFDLSGDIVDIFDEDNDNRYTDSNHDHLPGSSLDDREMLNNILPESDNIKRVTNENSFEGFRSSSNSTRTHSEMLSQKSELRVDKTFGNRIFGSSSSCSNDVNGLFTSSPRNPLSRDSDPINSFYQINEKSFFREDSVRSREISQRSIGTLENNNNKSTHASINSGLCTPTENPRLIAPGIVENFDPLPKSEEYWNPTEHIRDSSSSGTLARKLSSSPPNSSSRGVKKARVENSVSNSLSKNNNLSQTQYKQTHISDPCFPANIPDCSNDTLARKLPSSSPNDSSRLEKRPRIDSYVGHSQSNQNNIIRQTQYYQPSSRYDKFPHPIEHNTLKIPSPIRPIPTPVPSRPIPSPGRYVSSPSSIPGRPTSISSPSRPIPRSTPGRPLSRSSPSRPISKSSPSRPISSPSTSSMRTAWTLNSLNRMNVVDRSSSSIKVRNSERGSKSIFSPSVHSNSSSHKSTPQNNSAKEPVSTSEGVEEVFLSIFFGCGQLGAALYNTSTYKLELMRDIPELPPLYEMLCSLIYQEEPNYILVSARQDQDMTDLLTRLCGEKSESDTSGSDQVDSVFRRMSLIRRPSMEFGSRSGRQRLMRLEVPGKPSETDQEQLIKLSSYVDFSADSMVRAAGALLRYLDKNRPGGLDLDNNSSPGVLFIDSMIVSDILTLDESAFSSLQIFSVTTQLSGSRAGSWNKSKEGLSLYNILNRCSSVVGSRLMRYMLRCPSTNIEVLTKRQEALTIFTNSSNLEFVQALMSSLRQIKNYHRIMKKVSCNTMTVSDWQSLFKTVTGLVQMFELASRVNVPVLTDIKNAVTEEIFLIRNVMDQVIDFQTSISSGKFTVKPGVDEVLDEKRRLHNALPDLLSAVAQEEARHLPKDIDVCTVCYLPQVGYLIAIPCKQKLLDSGFNYREITGFEFTFESNGAMHYRNSRTLALDDKIGDVVMEITSLEIRITSRVTELVLKSRSETEKVVSLCGQLDCLLSMARVSKENNWTKPNIVKKGDLVIQEGRHPLQEMSTSQFIANSTKLGNDDGRLHLLTGPNSSGKSIYLKQVGLIVYLAHLGCWVPAESATIPITDRILTRIQTVESVSLGMSSFLCDLNQVSSVLRRSTSHSLLLVDEFGKGTSPVDGESLLTSVILELLSRSSDCPLCLFSTHFHRVAKFLGPRNHLSYFMMETKEEKSGLLYLYNLVRGISECSEARAVALKAGISEQIVDRAGKVQDSLSKGQTISQESLLPIDSVHKLITELLEINFEVEDEIQAYTNKVTDFPM